MKKVLMICLVAVGLLGLSAVCPQTAEAKKKTKTTKTIKNKNPQKPKQEKAQFGYRLTDEGKLIPNQGKPVVACFSADWCRDCQVFKPIFNAVKKKYSDKVIFVVINVDNNKKVSEYYDVTWIPTTIYFSTNGDTTVYSGDASEEVFDNFILNRMRPPKTR